VRAHLRQDLIDLVCLDSRIEPFKSRQMRQAPKRLSTGCGGSAIRNVELAVIAQRLVQEAVRRAHAHHRDS